MSRNMLQKPLSYVTGDDLAQIIRSGRNKHAIIDLRDDDWVRGNIRTATHIPSREFDYERAKRLAQELEQNKIENVVFHCHFSQQRGPTGAGLFRRVLEVELPDSKMDVNVLRGGWMTFFRQFKDKDDLIERHKDYDDFLSDDDDY